MRWSLALLIVSGCASAGARQTPAFHVAACEQQQADAQRRAEVMRADAFASSEPYEVRKQQLDAAWAEQRRAERIGRDCDTWRAKVASDEARPRARHRIGAAMSGLGGAYREAGSVPPPPPTYHCHTDYIGGVVCDPR